MPDWLIVLLTLGVGVLTGILSGMFGVGGAVVSTPAIRALGATPLQSVGSTLPSIIPGSISGSLRYHRDGLIRGRTVAWTAFPGVFASVAGALLAGLVPGNGHLLMILTAGLVGFTAFRMGRSVEPPDPGDAEPAEDVGTGPDPSGVAVLAPAAWWQLALIGMAAGLLSGLLGIGGGILMVPAFTSWAGMPIKEAIGTSLACVGILAVPGTITHQLLGHIDWLFALPLAIGIIPGARIGAHLAIRSTDAGLRRTVSTVLGTIALVYAIGEIVALVR